MFRLKDKKTRKERGYGQDWTKLRDSFILAHPYCAECDRKGWARLAEEVDHIIPFNGVDDPNRLNPGNLQSLCKHHHLIKTRLDHTANARRKKHDQR